MERDSRSRGQGKGSLEELLRERVRGIIELIVEQELEEALGAASSARVGAQRAGYRHGHRARTLSTSLGRPVLRYREPASQARMANGTNGAARSFRVINAAPSRSMRRFWACI
jgi:mutator family transposase